MKKIKIIPKTTDVRIGDHISLSINVPTQNLKGKEIKLISPYKVGEISKDGLSLLSSPKTKDKEITLDMVSYKAGSITLLPFKINVDGETLFETTHLNINVKGIEGKIELIEIKGPKTLAPPYFYWTGLFISIILVLLFLWIFVRKYFYKKVRGKIKEEKQIDPYTKAIKSLNSIEREKLFKINKKLFVTKVSETLKRFIDEEYKVYVMEMTTAEFSKFLRKDPRFNVSTAQKLQEYFLSADLIKFKEREEEVAKDFISKTREFIKTLRLKREEAKPV